MNIVFINLKNSLKNAIYWQVILHVVSLVLISTSYQYLYSYIENNQKIDEQIILLDIQQSFVKYLKEELNPRIYEVTNDKTLLNQSEYVYELEQQLDRIFSRYIYYDVLLNDLSILTNAYNDQQISYSLVDIFNLTKEVKCFLKIAKNPNASYFKEILEENNKVLDQITCVYLFLLLFVSTFIFLSIKITKLQYYKDKSLKQLSAYLNVKRKNTIEFHNYYMQKNNNLISLPLNRNPEYGTEGTNIIDLKTLRDNIKDYIEGYCLYIQKSIHLQVTIDKHEFITIKFDCEVFKQIVYSIICNIIYFVKSTSISNINIIFTASEINFTYTKTFPINIEVLRIYTDSVVLGEFFDPFILGFSDIFGVLDKLGIEYIINSEQDDNLIQVIINKLYNEKSQNFNSSNVIDLSKIIEMKGKNNG